MLAYHGNWTAVGVLAAVIVGPSDGALTVKNSVTRKRELIDVFERDPGIGLHLGRIRRCQQGALDLDPHWSPAWAHDVHCC